MSVIANKAVFQVIGEQAASGAGLDTRDIDVLMQQLNVERNVAIQALRRKGDLMDAMLDVANK